MTDDIEAREPDTEPDDDEALVIPRGPIQGLDDVADYLAAHPFHTGSFLRGLTIGALVGAAIAGLSIWRRLRPRPEGKPLPPK